MADTKIAGSRKWQRSTDHLTRLVAGRQWSVVERGGYDNSTQYAPGADGAAPWDDYRNGRRGRAAAHRHPSAYADRLPAPAPGDDCPRAKPWRRRSPHRREL